MITMQSYQTTPIDSFVIRVSLAAVEDPANPGIPPNEIILNGDVYQLVKTAGYDEPRYRRVGAVIPMKKVQE